MSSYELRGGPTSRLRNPVRAEQFEDVLRRRIEMARYLHALEPASPFELATDRTFRPRPTLRTEPAPAVGPIVRPERRAMTDIRDAQARRHAPHTGREAVRNPASQVTEPERKKRSWWWRGALAGATLVGPLLGLAAGSLGGIPIGIAAGVVGSIAGGIAGATLALLAKGIYKGGRAIFRACAGGKRSDD